MALNVGELFATIDLRDRLSAGLRRALDNLRDSAKKFDIDVGSVATSTGQMTAKFTAAALAASTLAGGLAVSAQGAVGLAAALAPAAGIVAALPGAAALAGGAFATLSLALSGVGDGFKAALSGDYEKFMAGAKELGQAASEVAYELFQMAPAFQGLKSSAQDALFTPLIGQMWSLLPLLNSLEAGTSSVAAEFGKAAADVLQFASSAATVSAVQSIFGSLRSAVAAIRPAIDPLLSGFRDLAVVGAQFSAGLAPGIASAAARFGEFLSRAAESGQALSWMQGAIEVFRQLGGILGNVAGILRGVFEAMRTGGSDALGVIGQLLGKVNEFVNSAQGQQILVTIFQALSQVGQALFPIFTALGGALAQVAPHIANIATALGPGLAAAVNALGPALAALGPGLTVVADMLAKAFASPELQAGLLALGQGLSAALAAVAPLLPVVAQLAGILGQVLGLALQNLSAILGPVIAALADALQPALAAISSAIAQLSPLIPPIAAAFGQVLGAVVQQLLPPILQLIPALLSELVPAFVQLTQAILPVLPVLTDLAVMFIQNVLPALTPIIPMLVQLGMAFIAFAGKVGEVVGLVKPFIDRIVSAFTWMYNTLVGHSVIPDMVRGIGQWIGTTLVGFFRDLPGKIVSAVGNIGARVAEIGRNIVSGIWNGIQSMWSTFYSQVTGFFSGIVDSVKGALGISSPSKVFAGIGTFMMQGLSRGIDRTAGLVTASLNRVATLAARTAMPDLAVPGVTVPDGLGGGAVSRAVVNVTNHYPQAEPTSVSINRGLQYVGAMGVI